MLLGLWVRPVADLAQAQEPPPRATVTPTNPADVPERPTLTPTNPADVPERPTSTPTPRPTLPPTPYPTASASDAQESHAQIILVASGENDGQWAVVQWLDGQNVWQDVEGWAGDIRQGQIRWYVQPKEFGQGPFRWAIFDKADGQRLCTSEPFQLPGDSLSEVRVDPGTCVQEPGTKKPSVPDSLSAQTSAREESLYLLRVHRSPDGAMQFTIHNIDTFETWSFSSFENLRDFLQSRATLLLGIPDVER